MEVAFNHVVQNPAPGKWSTEVSQPWAARKSSVEVLEAP